MAEKVPFDEDMMTLFMGVGDPEEPGQHGRTMAPGPTDDAVGVLTQIRDLCEDFLRKTGKDEDDREDRPDKDKKPKDKGFDEEEEDNGFSEEKR